MQTCTHCNQTYDEQAFASCPMCRTGYLDPTPGADPAPAGDLPSYQFKDQSRLTKVISFLLIAQMVIGVIGLGSKILERRLLDAMVAGSFPSQSALQAAASFNDQREQVISWVAVGLFFLCGLLVIDWLKTANRNARALGATDLLISPGWSAGWFFIPVACLWKPYQAVKQIWQASHQPRAWRSFPATWLLPLWWACWLVNSVMNRVLARLDFKTMSELYHLNGLKLISGGIFLVLCLLFWEVVRQIHRAQQVTRATQQDLSFSFTEM